MYFDSRLQNLFEMSFDRQIFSASCSRWEQKLARLLIQGGR